MSKSQYVKLAKALIPCSETSLSYSEIMSLAVNVLLHSPSFEQARIPQEDFIMTSPKGSFGSVVYFDLDYASKLVHAMIYDDVTLEQYVETNPVTKNNWYAKIGGSSSGSSNKGNSGSTTGNNNQNNTSDNNTNNKPSGVEETENPKPEDEKQPVKPDDKEEEPDDDNDQPVTPDDGDENGGGDNGESNENDEPNGDSGNTDNGAENGDGTGETPQQ